METTYEKIIHTKNTIAESKILITNIPNWSVKQSEKEEAYAKWNKRISEAKANLIQLYKDMIADCEMELELLQPDYQKSLTYRMMENSIKGVESCLRIYPNSTEWNSELRLLKQQLAAYEAKHNINPENKNI